VGRAQKVFLNFPYDKSYEDVFLGIVCALVRLGRTPVVTFDLPDHGQGRLKRIWDLLRECAASIHDLSAVGLPVRFNMPFELGLACGLQRARPQNVHRFFIFETERNRIDYTTSDLKGIDPRIHGRTATGAIAAVLDVLDSSRGRISTEDVLWVYRRVKRIVPGLKRRHRSRLLYRRAILNDLVEAALVIRSLSTRGDR
jgi:hypothetical protein